MSDEQPDGEPNPSVASEWLNSAVGCRLTRHFDAIPPEPPVVVVRRHMHQMTHAQRGAVSQLIKENEQLRIELAAATGVPRTQEVAASAEADPGSTGIDMIASDWVEIQSAANHQLGFVAFSAEQKKRIGHAITQALMSYDIYKLREAAADD